jgi:hypothetical protein
VRRVAVVGGASWADWSVWTLRFVVSQLVAGGILEWRRFWGFRSLCWVMASVHFCSFRQQLVDRVPVEYP